MKRTQRFLALLAALTLGMAASAAPSPTPKVGDKAPLVKGTDQDGKKWKLEDEIGKDVILLYFYPKDDTPGCTKEACGLRDKLTDLKSEGVKVIGVSADTVDSHKDFVFKYDLNFPLISDPDGKIIDAYGARMPDKKMARRVSFLIGLDGNIVFVVDSPKAEVHLADMQRAIKNLKAATPQ